MDIEKPKARSDYVFYDRLILLFIRGTDVTFDEFLEVLKPEAKTKLLKRLNFCGLNLYGQTEPVATLDYFVSAYFLWPTAECLYWGALAHQLRDFCKRYG